MNVVIVERTKNLERGEKLAFSLVAVITEI